MINKHYVLTPCDSIPDGQITVRSSMQRHILIYIDKHLYVHDSLSKQAARLTYQNYLKDKQAWSYGHCYETHMLKVIGNLIDRQNQLTDGTNIVNVEGKITKLETPKSDLNLVNNSKKYQ